MGNERKKIRGKGYGGIFKESSTRLWKHVEGVGRSDAVGTSRHPYITSKFFWQQDDGPKHCNHSQKSTDGQRIRGLVYCRSFRDPYITSKFFWQQDDGPKHCNHSHKSTDGQRTCGLIYCCPFRYQCNDSPISTNAQCTEPV
jgi:hypothetical protein